MFIATANKPKGPSLSSLQLCNFELSGNRLELQMPYSNYGKMPDTMTGQFTGNIYDQSQMDDRATGSNVRNYRSLGCGFRYWKFSGLPVFQTELATLKLSVSVGFFPDFSSLFRPQRFEKAIERRLYCGDGTATKGYTNRANWAVHDIDGWQWVSYEIVQNISGESLGDVYWCCAISDEHMLTIHFEKSFFGSNKNVIDRCFREVIDCVVGGLKFTPSADGLSQKKSVLDAYPQEKIAVSLPPYKYDRIDVQDEVYIFTQVSREHAGEWEYDQIDVEAKRIFRKQIDDAKELEERIMASHLKFDE